MGWLKNLITSPDPSHEAAKVAAHEAIEKVESHFALSWNTKSDEGEVRMSLKDLSTEWKEFVPGKMWCRLIDEPQYLDGTIVLCKIIDKLRMDWQWHFEQEDTMPLNLSMMDYESGKIIPPGNSITWPSKTPHEPAFEEDRDFENSPGFIIVHFSPALPIL